MSDTKSQNAQIVDTKAVRKSKVSRDSHLSDDRVYDSINSAAVGLGVSKEFLQSLKKAGAPGFRNTRVYSAQLEPYLRAHRNLDQENGTASKHSLECRRLLAQAKRIEHRLSVERGEYVAASLWDAAIRKCGAEVKQFLRQKENEFPALVSGMDVDQTRAAFRDHVTEDLLTKFESLNHLLPEPGSTNNASSTKDISAKVVEASVQPG